MSGKKKLPPVDPFAQASLELPELPNLDAGLPELPSLDEMLNPPKTMMESMEEDGVFGDNNEENTAGVNKVIAEEFAAIHEGRRKQAVSIELANDTEYWFAMYFQTRDQKEAFLKAMGWFERGDKYLDGTAVAKKLGIELPPRPAPYKVGRLDKKLFDLTDDQ